ncbi:hypothetical protein PIB30_024608 [Stylosanthes scabra]|uniref:Uncharacterized protein n=1 Tax=Stylosanthes scabra TaxID=79078 RepID=A0ABU6VAP5_9FABA|nr:hypothetical protein [Stylosanthes scabra]
MASKSLGHGFGTPHTLCGLINDCINLLVNDRQHPATRNLTVPHYFIATSIIAHPKVNCHLSPHSISSVFGDKYQSFAAVCLWRHCLPPRSHRRCNPDADESPPKKGLLRYSLGVCMVYLIEIT